MKGKIKKIIHQLILPRGNQFIEDPELAIGWEKNIIVFDNKQICVLHQSPVTAHSIIILAHPYLSEARQFYLKRGHAAMYLNMGFHVVLFDFNGFGESPFEDFNYEEDVRIVAEHFKAKYPDKNISGHGISFGASHVLSYATKMNHHFKKIIVENCLDSNLTYYRKRNIKLFYVMKSLMAIFPGANKNHDYVKSAGNILKVENMLLIYNQEDDLTTIEMGQKILAKCNVPAHLEIFKGKHLEAYQKDTLKYVSVISKFLIISTKI